MNDRRDLATLPSALLGIFIGLLAAAAGYVGVLAFQWSLAADTSVESALRITLVLIPVVVPALAVGLLVRKLDPHPVGLIPAALAISFLGYVMLSIEFSIFGAEAALLFVITVLVVVDWK